MTARPRRRRGRPRGDGRPTGAPWADYLARFLLPTLIGNTIGGVMLVALVNHAQVASELEATPEGPRD